MFHDIFQKLLLCLVLDSIFATSLLPLNTTEKYTAMPELGNSENNLLIFAASGGGCALCLIVGIIVCIVISKKKTRPAGNIEMPLQPAAEGKSSQFE